MPEYPIGSTYLNKGEILIGPMEISPYGWYILIKRSDGIGWTGSVANHLPPHRSDLFGVHGLWWEQIPRPPDEPYDEFEVDA